MAVHIETAFRQEQIAAAALDVVARQGLRRLSLAAVARRVGLVPSAIYRHFSSKDEILDAVLDTVRDRLLGNVAAARAETTDALECLHRLLERHVALIRENKALPRLVFSEEVYAGRPRRRARMFAAVSAYLGEIAEIVRAGQHAGRIRRSADPDAVSMMFLGLVQPAAVLHQMSDGAFDLSEHTERTWRLLRHAIEVA